MDIDITIPKFKIKLKEMLKELSLIDKKCIAQVWKIELIEDILKLKISNTKIDKEFYTMFVIHNTDEDLFLRPSELCVGDMKKITAIFNSKTKTTKIKRMFKYFQKKASLFLFKYDYNNQMKRLNKLLDLIK